MKKPSLAFVMIIVSIFCGLLSGIIGVIVVSSMGIKLPFIGSVNYSSPNLDNRITIEKPLSVIVSEDTQMTQIENNLLPTIVNIYKAKKSTDPVSAAYTESDVIGRGFVLTDDGWIVSTASVLDGKSDYVVVGYQNKQYVATSTLVDRATGLVFAKMSTANLPVAKIGSSDALKLGQSVAIASARNQLEAVRISKIGYNFADDKSLVLNSDYFKKRIDLAGMSKQVKDGSPLINYRGEVVGIIVGGSAIGSDYFSNIINQILASKKIVRASLSLDYLDLAQVDGAINYGDKGAYIVNEPIKGTAAYGLVHKGDIIRRVNDDELNAFNGLAEVINKYRMGDKIELLLSRNNKDASVDLTLK